MPKKNYTRLDDVTQSLYANSEIQLLNRRIRELNQQGNEADLHGDEEADYGLENAAAFPPLSGTIPVPAQVPPAQTWQQVVKGESSASGESESSSNPPCDNPPEQQITSTSSNADEKSEGPSSNAAATAAVNSDLDVENPSEQQITSTSSNADETSQDPSSIAAAVNSDLDVGQVSAEHNTMNTTALELHSFPCSWSNDPIYCPTSHDPYRAFPPLNKAVGKSKNRDAIRPVPVKGESSASGKSESSSNPPFENLPEQQITSTSSNADEPSLDPSSIAAAVNSDLDAGQASNLLESAMRNTALARRIFEPTNLYTGPIFCATSHEPYRDASNSEQNVKISENEGAGLLPPCRQEVLNMSPARDPSFRQSENLQRGIFSGSPIEGVMAPDAELSYRLARQELMAQSSTHSEQSADTRGFGSLPLNQPSRPARHMQQQRASSGNAAYGNEFNVHPSSRDRSLHPESFPFNPSLGGRHTSSSNLNQISPSQHDGAPNFTRPMQQHNSFIPWDDGSLAPESTLYRNQGQPSQSHQGAPPRRSASQEQQSPAQPSQVQPGAQRRPHSHRYLGQPSQRHLGFNPRSSTHYGYPEQLDRFSPRDDVSLEPDSTLYSGQPSQAHQGAQLRGSRPFSYQGQQSQAPLRNPPTGNLELDPSQTHIPDEFQQQGDFPPNMPYPFGRNYR